MVTKQRKKIAELSDELRTLCALPASTAEKWTKSLGAQVSWLEERLEKAKESARKRKATAALTRDLQCAFGAERDTTTRG